MIDPMKSVDATPIAQAAFAKANAAGFNFKAAERGRVFLDEHAEKNAAGSATASANKPGMTLHQTSVENAPAGLVVVGIHDLLAFKLPPREVMLAPWLLSQSLNMVYAWRGIGKTHVALGIAYAVSSASNFLGWESKTASKVLYLDGEMPGAALQTRLAAIVAASEKEPEQGYLSIVTPDLQTGAMPDLGTWAGQDSINAAIESTGAVLIIVDNLSCLVRSGGRENDAESWHMISTWALAMRAKGKSVIFIHHAAKNGQQRGTSKREDLLDVVICLKRPPDYSPVDGAVFEIHYEKARNLSGEETNPIEAKLTTDEQGAQVWTWRALEDSTLDRVVELANEGLSQAEIANELELNRSTVSRAWRKADALGMITKKTSSKGRNQYNKGANDD